MAGNLLYIPYSIGMALVWIALVAILWRWRGLRSALKGALLAAPFFAIVQLYFWQDDFRFYAQSYLFSSTAYRCEYGDPAPAVSVPLPDRTVFLGKSDVCSPFYLTYADEEEFVRFYERRLPELTKAGKIVDYEARTPTDREGIEYTLREYELDLPSGQNMTIALHQAKEKDRRMLVVRFLPEADVASR